MGVLEKLPTCMMVGVLVMIFACLKRHTRCARLTLWAVGWTLVFTHFLAQLLEPAGRVIPFLRAADGGALQLSAVAFLVSVSAIAEDRAKRTISLLALSVPSVSYAALDAFGVHARWPYVLCLVACFGAAACFFVWVKRGFSPYLATVTLLCAIAFAWALRAALSGSFQEGTVVLLGIGFALPGVFICKNYWGASPGVLTISIGFFCWGAVFPIIFLASRMAPHLLLPAAIWDTPELFVAFGMILAVVEDKSHAIRGMENREAALNRQLQRFSAIAARLLSTADPETICPEIASAITELTSFPAAVILVESAEGTLRIASSSGVSTEGLQIVEQRTRDWNSESVQKICAGAQQTAKMSFVFPPGGGPAGLEGPDGSKTQSTVELLIPLASAAGGWIGTVALALSSNAALCVHDLERIESLAADLAVAVERKSLHTQLVCSEKLAAMGQLVAGVAHELNNPLTAIMGFGELIGDNVTSSRGSDQLKRLLSETRRMKRITDNLLRFSRQSSTDLKAAYLSPVVQDVLALCEYQTRKSKICVQTEIAPNLPLLAFTEDEIKQILLNLFNNSCDAMQSCEGTRQIRIRASQEGGRVLIQVEDSGPGFANLNRALDPFYTTKPVGKGTGLGLSVCCGIAKRRGGNLIIENLQPQGARVTVEVPVVPGRPHAAIMATAHA